MKKYTLGTFPSRTKAEEAISHLHSELGIATDAISYVYKNTAGEVHEVAAQNVTTMTTSEGVQKGAVIGGSIGALAGLAAIAGIIPIIGPIVAAGPLIATMGLGASALGTTAAGALTGAAAGSLIGALATLGVSAEKAQEYEDRVIAGNVLVAVHAPEGSGIVDMMADCGATDIETFMLDEPLVRV